MGIVVVTENDERMFSANGWNIDNDKTLTVVDGTLIVAQYSPGGWQYVLRADNEIPMPMPQDVPRT